MKIEYEKLDESDKRHAMEKENVYIKPTVKIITIIIVGK